MGERKHKRDTVAAAIENLSTTHAVYQNWVWIILTLTVGSTVNMNMLSSLNIRKAKACYRNTARLTVKCPYSAYCEVNVL